MITNERLKKAYLAHFGILGQKWGVRRYQNEDGSLTSQGKSRYQRGKEYNDELIKMRDKKYKEWEESKERKQKLQTAENLRNKYGLDADDGGGGDYSRYDEKTLNRAGTRYYNMMEDISDRDDIEYNKAKEHATKQFVKKYGQTGMDDLRHYQNMHTLKVGAALIGTYSALMLGAYFASRKKK